MQKIIIGLFSVWIVFSLSFFIVLLSQQPYSSVASISIVSAENTPQLTPTQIVTPTPSPTQTPTPTATLTPTPTRKVVPPSPTATPSLTTIENTSATPDLSIQGFIMQRINEYRSSQSLPPVSTDSQTCSFAKTRVAEISSSFNHDGFRSRIESKTLPYPTYSEVTENIAMNSDYKKVVQNWIESPGHAENMRKDTPFVCVEMQGNYYVYLGWRP